MRPWNRFGLVILTLASTFSACTAGTEEPQATITSEPTPTATGTPELLEEPTIEEFSIPGGSRPHDVAPPPDGTVWYTAQGSGELGRLDPSDGSTHHVDLGGGSAPHGVIVGPDDTAWVTDGGTNAIVRFDPGNEDFTTVPLPSNPGGVRQLLGRPGEVWGAESAADALVVVRT